MSKFDGDFIQYSDKKVKNETKNLALYFILHITLYIVLIFFAIFFIWYFAFISTHSFYAVKGPSMKYTLNQQIADTDRESAFDAVYINRIAKLRDYDIVVLNRQNDSDIIKRLMATEGDFITIAKAEDGNYRFYRIKNPTEEELANSSDDDAMLDEESGELGYRIRGYSNWKASPRGAETGDISVEVDGNVLTNRYEKNFYDTFLSYYGEDGTPYNYFVSANGLIYVQVPEGKVFCMGDNRGFSTDSRESGFFDRDQVVGRSEFVVYNFNFGNRIWEVVKFYFSEVEKFFAR